MRTAACRGVVLALALVAGCGAPTSEDRDNQRVVESILTAITLRNSRLLDEGSRLARERRDRGYLTEDEHQGLAAIVDKARRGDWNGAEEDGYRFREQRAFVKPGR